MMKIKKIIISIVLIVALIFDKNHLLNVENHFNGFGTVYIEVINFEQEIIKSRAIEFKENEKLTDIVREKFDNVVIEFNSFANIILEIEGIKTDFVNTYLKILVNGKYSNLGIDAIVLEDQMRIAFVEAKV